MITLGKAGTLHTKRQVYGYITKEDVAKKLFDDIAPKYADKNGGYTWNWLPFLWQNGGEFLNEDRTEAVFNSAEGVEAWSSGRLWCKTIRAFPCRLPPPA